MSTEAQVLALATSYEPIGRCSWRRAVTLWYGGKVAIEAEYDEEVHSVTFSMKTPAVIRFLRGPARARSRVRMSRENLILRDEGRCQYCGRRVSRGQMTLDHVVPRAQGGLTTWENTVTCCVQCNAKKAARTPEQAGMRLRQKPARPTRVADVWTLTMDRDQVPPSWRQFLADWGYWRGELDKE